MMMMIDRLNIEVSKLKETTDSFKSSFFKRSSPSRQKVSTKGNLTIFRKSQETEESITKDLTPFIRIEQNSKEFKLVNCKELNQSDGNDILDDLWLELPKPGKTSYPLPFFELKPNDILRLGDAFLEILSINFDSDFSMQHRNFTVYSSIPHSFSQHKGEDLAGSNQNIFSSTPTGNSFSQGAEQLCRICYTEVSEWDTNNLGITFCSCSGTLQYSHLSCMKRWLNKKIKYLFAGEEVMIFEATELQCEICLCEIPIRVLVKGNEYFMLDFEEKFKNHIIIRDLNNGLVSIVNLTNKNEVYIGNGTDLGCDLIVQNESVENFHCKLIPLKGKIFAEDLGTKTKTFLRIKDELTINPFVDKYKIRRGEWEFLIKPKRDPPSFFSFLCAGEAFCGRTSNRERDSQGKEFILE